MNTETCIYCDQEVPTVTEVPTDLDGWLERAEHHACGCEWICTHAHTLPSEVSHHDENGEVRTDKDALEAEIYAIRYPEATGATGICNQEESDK